MAGYPSDSLASCWHRAFSVRWNIRRRNRR